MEIEYEIKRKVFGQYLGQVAQWKNLEYTDKYETETMWDNVEYYIGNKAYLILKPLSEITDEDIIEVCKLQQEFKEQKDIKVSFDIDIKNKGCLDCCIEWDGYKHDYYQPVYSPTYQYLQLKGYDLPQYLLEGKTLQEVGLAIYE